MRSPHDPPEQDDFPLTRSLRTAGLIVIPLLLLLLGLLQWRQFDEARQLRAKVDETYETRWAISRFLSLHQDIETGQRGYVVTGQESFLKPYELARARIGPEQQALEKLLFEGAVSASARDELRLLSKRKLEFAAAAIRLRKEEGHIAAAELMAEGRGRMIMDRLRALIARLDSIERENLEAATAASAESRSKIQALTFGLEALFLLLLAGAAVLIGRNMSALRKAAGRLRDLSRRQEAIFDAATDGMMTHDVHGRIESLNPAAARMYGYQVDELVGRNISMLFENPPPPEAIEAYLRHLADNPPGTAAIQEFPAKRRDGSLYTSDVATSPVPLAEGSCFIAVIRDVTERKRVDRMKTEFVSTVSHELRTPLTSIAGSLGLLAGGAAGELPERADKLIRIAHSNSDRLVRLINDILDIEKIESGRMAFDIAAVPLQPLVDQAIQANAAFAAGYGVRLSSEGNAEGVSAKADADRLMQVLTNLLSNAAKFSRPGSEVTVAILPGRTSHRIAVRDHGPGIPDEFRDRIFSKFAQADSSDTREKGGTGLGLSIVKQIVGRLGGSVSFETELGKGTTFNVDLPAAGRPRGGAKPNILICQRNSATADTIQRTLLRAGFDSDIATKGEQVRALAAEKDYAAILLDLELQGAETIGLIRHLRGDPRYATTTILLATRNGSDGQVSQALAVADWLQKPISVESLLSGVKNAVPGEARPHILHVEDDPDVLRIVASAFEGRADLDSVTDLESARKALKARAYDLVILDIGLPGGSGLELLPEMHREDGTAIPVVIFSAQDEDPDLARRVSALLTKSRASLGDLVKTVEALAGKGAAGAPEDAPR